MDEIKMIFLGKEYCFPKEVQQYVSYCNKFEKITDDLMTVIGKRIKERWYDYPDKEFDELFRKAGKEVISYLSQDRIYDVTLSELIERNQGYISFQNVTKEGFQKWKNISVESIEEYIEGYKDAQSDANSKITGSGVTLYSNSLMAHMTFAALESNIIRKQVAQADKEYQKAMSELSQRNETRQQKKEDNFLYNELYPAYLSIIGTFVSELMEKYLRILSEYSVYDYSKVEPYNIEKSEELLENLKILDDKKEVLSSAFRNCPYNQSIYEHVINLGFMDVDTFMTMQMFYKDDDAIKYLQSHCAKNSNNMDILERYVPILAVAKNVEEKKIWHGLFSGKINKIVQWYQELNKILNSNEDIGIWIYDNICQDGRELLELDKTEIINRVSRQLKNYSMNGLSIYVNKGLIPLEKIRLTRSKADTIALINVEYCTLCVDRIEKYIQKLKENKEKEKQKKYLIEMEHKKKKKRIMKIVLVMASVMVAIFMISIIILTYLPSDKRFCADLEKCIIEKNKIDDLNSKEEYESLFDLEDDLLSYEGKWFRDKNIKDNCDLYIEGVKEQKESLKYYDTDKSKHNDLYANGYMKCSEAIVNLQAIDAIYLDKDIYAYYAVETLKNHIGRLIEGTVTFKTNEYYQYYLPVLVDNCTLANFGSMTIKVWWNDDENDVYIHKWESGKEKELRIPISYDIVNLSESIKFSMEFTEYEVESLAEN